MTRSLTVVYPNKSIYSETFIRSQLQYLQPQFEFYDGWYPFRDKNGNNFLKFPIKNLMLRGAIKWLSLRIFHSIYTKQFSVMLNRQKTDVVLAEYGPTGCSVMDACEKTKIPLIVHFHGFDASDKATINKYGVRYKKLFQVAKCIIVVSEDMKKKLIELGAPQNKIINNPCGVDLNIFDGTHPEKNFPLFISVGRFAEKKAPHLTIKAFNEVYKKHKEAELLMIGGGPLLNYCKKLVSKLRLREAVKFMGILKPDEVRLHLKNARAFVQHSVTADTGDMEGTPVSIMEASAMALPIIRRIMPELKKL